MIALGLGANLGDRQATLQRAVNALPLSEKRASSIYESPALLPPGAPADWDLPFLNQVVVGNSAATPEQLLESLKRLEHELGRKPRSRWGPREIDIDILIWDERVVETEQLRIPHSQLLWRAFALVPLAEIAPEWRYPALGPYRGKSARELACELFADGGKLQELKRWMPL